MYVELPDYDGEIVVEMYLEDRSSLKCIVSETLPYSSTTINSLLDNAIVIFSDGSHTDTLGKADIYDYESGRKYNYSRKRRPFLADSTKTYTLRVIDSLNREVTATTTFPTNKVKISEIVYNASSEQDGKFSVGFSFTDPAGSDNYYRAIFGKGVNNYTASHTDLIFPDIAFEGKEHSVYSQEGYKKNDTVTVRLYTLQKQHYNFLQLTESARTANANPFMQPVQVKSNIIGGQGIFTAIQYDEKKIVIR